MSEYFFLTAQISKCTKVGDDEGDAELVFRADRAEVDAPVFQSDAAAATVVIDLRYLVLQDAICHVVADARGGVESFAIQAAVTEEGAHLIGERLESRVGLKTEMRNRGEEFGVGLHFDE